MQEFATEDIGRKSSPHGVTFKSMKMKRVANREAKPRALRTCKAMCSRQRKQVRKVRTQCREVVVYDFERHEEGHEQGERQ